jgi:NCAIR mutase (PurE)-related protein
MNPKQILELLENIRQGTLTPDQGLERLKHLPFEDLGFARVDHHRTLRQGFPEVVFGPGKTSEQVVAIVKSLLRQKSNILITRSNNATYKQVFRHTRKAKFNALEPSQSLTIGPFMVQGR